MKTAPLQLCGDLRALPIPQRNQLMKDRYRWIADRLSEGWSYKEVAEALHINKTQITRYVKEGKVPARRYLGLTQVNLGKLIGEVDAKILIDEVREHGYMDVVKYLLDYWIGDLPKKGKQ